MSETITPEKLAETLTHDLQLYCADTQIMISQAVDKRAAELVKELKETSPKEKGKNGGAYAKSWTSKVETNNFSRYTRRVYNRKHYRLTHLLENGHEKRNGGRTKAILHIGPASEKIQAEFVKDVEDALSEGGGLRSNHIKEIYGND